MRYLDPAVLAKLRSLQLRARVIVEGALSGLHRSPHHGSSVEFAEHKEYSPGDEVKHIDWKAYGKLDRYYVKRYEDETELTAWLMLDASGSMGYAGTGQAPSKLEYGATLLAALAYLLSRQQDRIALYAMGARAGGGDVYVPPRGRSSHLADVYAQLERVIERGGDGPTTLARGLDRVAELSRRRRSLVVLVSDLFDRSPEVQLLLRRLRAQRHDVVVFQVLDRDELELPFEGLTLFESMEDERRLLADPRSVRDAYLKELNAFLEQTRRDCAEGDIERRLVVTDEPLERVLLDFLTARTAARGGLRPRGRGAA